MTETALSAPASPTFTHPLNLLLLASAGASAAWVGDWRPLAVGVAAELAWWAVRPAMERRRRAAARRIEADASEQTRLRTLSEPLRRRFLELDRVRADIGRLVEANPSLEAVGLEAERVKVDRLLDGWLGLAAQVARMQAMLAADDAAAEGESAAAARAQLEASEAELGQVEASLRDLRDRVVSMTAPADLGGELDALVSGVEAAERTAREMARMEEGHVRAARASQLRASKS